MLLSLYMRAQFGLILTIPTLLFAFQNCGKAASPNNTVTDGAGRSKSQTVIGSTAGFNKITYDPLLGLDQSTIHIELDVTSGAFSATVSGATQSCVLDGDRLQEARDILAASQICEPGPLPPGYVSCLALGVADIELSNAMTRTQLRPVICNSGVFLCDGNDAKLRALLTDLQTNLPAGCGG